MKLTFSVPGNAVPKQSFRYASQGHSYQSPRVKEWEEAVGWAAKDAWHDDPVLCPLAVTLTFYLSHKRRVDWENLSKGTIDALKNIVFVDDAQIVQAFVYKFQPTRRALTIVSVEFNPQCPDLPPELQPAP